MEQNLIKESYLVQGSEEWKKYRRTRITSTDASTIMEVNPWCTPYMLWQRKLGIIPEQEENEAMRYGKQLEDEARQLYIKHMHRDFFPSVVIHPHFSWMMSSLDGLDQYERYAVEIKCSKRYLEQAQKGVVDDYTFSQIQHHLAILGHYQMDLFCYWDKDCIWIPVLRDEDYIGKLIDKEKEFYRCLNELEPPPLTDKDIVQRDDTQWQVLAHLWQSIQGAMKELEKHQEEVRKQLIEMAGNSPSEGSGLRVTPYMRRGAIQFGNVPELKGIDLEPYRKEAAMCWRLQATDKEKV